MADATHEDGIAILVNLLKDSTTGHETTTGTDSHDNHLVGLQKSVADHSHNLNVTGSDTSHMSMPFVARDDSVDLVQRIESVNLNSRAVNATNPESSSMDELEPISPAIRSSKRTSLNDSRDLRDGDAPLEEMQYVNHAKHSVSDGSTRW